MKNKMMVPWGTMLLPETVDRIKVYAAKSKRKQYDIADEAITEYLNKKETP